MTLALLLAVAHAAPTAVVDVTSPRYRNVILNVAPTRDYVEVCFKAGQQLHDTHVGGGSSVGGNCEPGDAGFLIELVPRSSKKWPDARAACTADGLRLPEVFEFMYACNNAVTLGFAATTDLVGWMSNEVAQMDTSYGPRVLAMSGNGTCTDWNLVSIISTSSYSFLCAL